MKVQRLRLIGLRQTRLGLRRASGAAVIELAMSFFALMVLVMVSVDIGVILYGAFLNDRACRVAVRAAAQGKDLAEATKLAKRTVVTIDGAGNWVKSPELVVPIVYEDYGGNYTPANSPYVSVTTTTKVDLPAPVAFAGNTFMPAGMTVFKQTYTFPIVKAR